MYCKIQIVTFIYLYIYTNIQFIQYNTIYLFNILYMNYSYNL